MNRFLASLSLLAAFVAASLGHAGEPSSTTRWPFFPMDTAIRDLSLLGKIEELGYDGIGWRFEQSEQLATSVARIRESGLELFAVYATASLSRDGVGFRGDLDARLEALSGSATTLWLAVNSSDFAPSDSEGDAVAVPELRRLADRAARQGARVALYPHAGSWIERIGDALRIARQVERPNFGVTFNLAHSLRLGEERRIPELLEEAAPLLFLVTVNGADTAAAGAGWERLIRPLDEGDYDLRAFLSQLDRVGYRGPVGLQGFGVKATPVENLARSATAWSELVAEAAPARGR